MSEKLKKLMAEYGRVALVVYLVLFVLVFAGSAIGLKMGFDLGGAGGNLGTAAAAYAVTKVSQPLRILATLALTPLVATVLGRRAVPVEGDETAEESGAA